MEELRASYQGQTDGGSSTQVLGGTAEKVDDESEIPIESLVEGGGTPKDIVAEEIEKQQSISPEEQKELLRTANPKKERTPREGERKGKKEWKPENKEIRKGWRQRK